MKVFSGGKGTRCSARKIFWLDFFKVYKPM